MSHPPSSLRRPLLVASHALLAVACGASTVAPPRGDASADTGARAVLDAAPADTGAPDTGTRDTGTRDTGTRDAGVDVFVDPCPPPRALCGGRCVDPRTDIVHCGGCNASCAAPLHGRGVCATGACDFACDAGYVRSGAQCTPEPPRVAQIAGGGGHTCVRVNDGTVRCWGENLYGQLGDGTTSARATPTLVRGLDGVVQIAAGAHHTCALRDDGAVRCWGKNDHGQLGDGTRTRRPVPVTVGGLGPVVAIDAGGAHTCARRADGAVVCWGHNGLGQIGDGAGGGEAVALAPARALLAASAGAVRAGGSHTCARGGGQAWCWGEDVHGQLGDGRSGPGVLGALPRIVSGLAGVTEVDAGAAFTCALVAGGAARCWGMNVHGQVGDGTLGAGAQRATPTAVAGLAGAVALVAGGAHACVRMGDGAVRCWGSNADGQVGDGTTADRATPVSVRGLGDVIEVVAGSEHTCARDRASAVYCWGSNGWGQLGRIGGPSSTPVRVPGV